MVRFTVNLIADEDVDDESDVDEPDGYLGSDDSASGRSAASSDSESRDIFDADPAAAAAAAAEAAAAGTFRPAAGRIRSYRSFDSLNLLLLLTDAAPSVRRPDGSVETGHLSIHHSSLRSSFRVLFT